MADPRPLYARVEQALLERIHRRYRPGDLLPTQQELAREFGTSLITVKRALDEIARRGLLRSTRGRGTVVLRPVVEDDRRGLTSWTDTMTGLGRTPRTLRCRLRVRVPPPAVARALGLKARERTVVVERLRALDGGSMKNRGVRMAMRGSGFVAEFYLQGLANVNGQRVVVNYSRSGRRAREFARRWGIPESATSLKTVVARDDVDLFVIALPNEEHLKASLLLSKAGRYQFC